MAGKIQGITIEVGADLKGLNKAIRDANKELGSIQRELKGVDSLLKLDPSNVELLAQKEKLLADAVQGTSDKLDQLKQAKAEADKTMAEGGEVNQEEYRNLQREIASTENKLKDLKKEQQNFGSVAKQQLDQVAKKFENVGSKVEGFGKKMSGVSAAAGGALAGMGGLAVKAGQFADDINTLSKVTGIGTDELQRIAAASDLVDVSTETVAKSMKKLTSQMGSGSDVFKSLGIDIRNADGSLRDSNEVFYESIDALGKIENETERDALAMSLFGKSATDLNPLIEAGSAAFLEASENAHIMSQAELDAANEFNDVIDRTKATVGTAMMSLGATIGQVLMPFLQAAAEKVTALAGYLADMNPTALTVIMVILGLVAALAPVTILVGKVITSVGTIIKILPMLKTAIMAVNTVLKDNAIGIVITAVAALIGYLVHLYQTNEDFRNKVNAVWEAIKNKFSALAAKFKEIVQGIKNVFSNLITTLPSIGMNIVKGILQGITNAKTWMLNKIKEWCGSILNGIKAFFGIHSPSQVMADTVGFNISAGVAEGIEDGATTVEDAMSLLEDTITDYGLGDVLSDLDANIGGSMAISTEVANNQQETMAQMIGACLLEGLAGIQDTILSAMPSSVALNINGRQMARALFDDLDAAANARGRIHSPSASQIRSIAASIL